MMTTLATVTQPEFNCSIPSVLPTLSRENFSMSLATAPISLPALVNSTLVPALHLLLDFAKVSHWGTLDE